MFSFAGVAAADEDGYADRIRPFMQRYCVDCHRSDKKRGELDLTATRTGDDVVAEFREWQTIAGFIRSGEMPPEDAKLQPTLQERAEAAGAVTRLLAAAARRHAGDPGHVPPRRLSNTEYDTAIRDLTGVDIRPTREFPPDPAAGEGFDNTGEALGMSPSLLKKYLGAAQTVADHMVLRTTGVAFAPFPVTSYNERKKLTEQALIDFYRNRDVDVDRYLEAAWRFHHAAAPKSLGDWAASRQLSAKYLAALLQFFAAGESREGGGDQAREKGAATPVSALRRAWRQLPPPADDTVPLELRAIQRQVTQIRQLLGRQEGALIRSNAGNWPIQHLHDREQYAAQRRQASTGAFASRQQLPSLPLRRIAPRDNAPSQRQLAIRIQPLAGGGTGWVELKRPLLSKSNQPPQRAGDEQKHQAVTLRDALAGQTSDGEGYSSTPLSFGGRPDSEVKVDGNSLLLPVPGSLELPLSAAFLEKFDGYHLHLDCEWHAGDHAGVVAVEARVLDGANESLDGAAARWLASRDDTLSVQLDRDAAEFCGVFPNRFFYVDDQRGLAAGFHLVEGFFRDDLPLRELVLDDGELQELDALWRELNFVTNSAETLLRGFVWFERSERHVLHDKRFDFVRPEDPALLQPAMLQRFERVYLEKLGVELVDDEQLAPRSPNAKFDMIHGFFERIRGDLRVRNEQLAAAEQQGLADVLRLADRAFRRPLSDDESKSLTALYHELRNQGQGAEASLRGILTAVLMSPAFQMLLPESPPGAESRPLSDHALATRLSLLIWSSLPDQRLRELADHGQLHDPQVLIAETRRMLNDPKAEAFAREFFGQWLRYRDYLVNDSVNASAFPEYTDTLRQAMHQEPTRLAADLLRHDQPVTLLLNSDRTFVNQALAKHYGGEIERQFRRDLAKLPRSASPEDTWLPVEGLHRQGRGGLFGMAAVLAKNSAGERTSPVKRGFWTVHHLLGQHFPPPPPDVPELPADERKAERTIRQLLAEHAASPRCAMCHEHFDSLGLALEGFDPIGRSRTRDLGGRAIDNRAQLPDGQMAEGVAGLMHYVESQRKQDFIRTLCRKFLGYALGRSVALSDEPLLEEMAQALESREYLLSALFETVVASRQFREQRGRDFQDPAAH
ncbi:MAG: DUF1592 domain-containing protein [Planctomycetales bacterium]|nr:DUF1592 domain-containing protein [Planctomycetales bacterium]